MDKKTIFTIDIYEKYNFLNDTEIDKIISLGSIIYSSTTASIILFIAIQESRAGFS